MSVAGEFVVPPGQVQNNLIVFDSRNVTLLLKVSSKIKTNRKMAIEMQTQEALSNVYVHALDSFQWGHVCLSTYSTKVSFPSSYRECSRVNQNCY